MSTEWQALTACALVILTAAVFLLRMVRAKRTGGCPGCGACGKNKQARK